MNCELCNKPYNLSNRLPLMLPCCDESICKECQQEIAGAPQQETFTCPITSCKQLNNCQAKFRVVKAIEKLLKHSLGITCDEHINDNAEFYCEDHHKLICSKCMFTAHKDHNNKFISKQDILDYNKILLEKLKVEFEIIKDVISDIEAYSNNEKHFTSSQYMKLIKEAQGILTVPQLRTQQERDSIKFMSYQPSTQIINEQQPQPMIQNHINEPQPSQMIQNIQIEEESKFDIGSCLITTQDQYQFIKDSIGQQDLRLKLLYRASRDGYEASQFHEKCDNKGNTLVVIQSEHGQIFGGYTSAQWISSDFEAFCIDAETFIFSLTKREKFTQYLNQFQAICPCKNYGPSFGYLGDIFISDKCNQNKLSHSNCGGTYNLPRGRYDSFDYAKAYLAGSHYFSVKDYEVFKVIINQQ